ncbi:prepilin-type N-terminal cleavage/methylation domain-containing protein [Candidatus Nomurabacteria bacterium]|nr:prepilin-type N-terminal cleavage/methylation domain-containing protein [Candidatus Nomurabacteria bacterium]
MKNQKGFTLVELLVVIAIIGILSSVAVVNLNSARSKAKVAAVKGSLAGLAAAGEIYYNDHNNYTGFCADSAVSSATSSAQATSGLVNADITCTGNADAWAVSAALDNAGESGNDYCISSTGSGSTAASGNACP